MKRYDMNSKEDLARLFSQKRRMLIPDQVVDDVKKILTNVKELGDSALYAYSKTFDKVTLAHLRVPKEELYKAYTLMPEDLRQAIKAMAENVKAFHTCQMQFKDVSLVGEGKRITQAYLPLERAGVYVPGGLAAYPSSVIMNVIPAQVAGVNSIALFTPPTGDINQQIAIWGTSYALGIDEVYSIGGAQAIAAAVLGTETISPVDIITGPGNIYVTEAKRQLFGFCKIDMLAGPSELMIVADEEAIPEYVAADLLAQAEHDEHALLYLVSVRARVSDIALALEEQLKACKGSVAHISIQNLKVFECASLDLACAVANGIAPEHLSLQFKDANAYVSRFHHAGSLFVGQFAPEAIGDYSSGANHILPTSGSARYDSGLNVLHFLKQLQIIEYNQQAFAYDTQASETIATYEKLPFHKNSLSIRRSLT